MIVWYCAGSREHATIATVIFIFSQSHYLLKWSWKMPDNDTVLVRIWLLGDFLVEQRKDNGSWETVEKTAWGKSYARLLLKRLLCATGRRLTRSTLLDDLWPDSSFKLADNYLYVASSKLRQVLHKEIIKIASREPRASRTGDDASFIYR
jgi:DNA-binding response OmpR family regulator